MYAGGVPEEPDDGAIADGPAAFALYWAYATGKGVKRDTDRAMACLRVAASAGHAPAQTALAEESYGRSKNEALHWFLAAAAQGHAEGQLGAGRMLFSGRFIARDEHRGLQLLAEAAAQGNADAVREHATATRQVEAAGRSDDENLTRAIAEHGLEAAAGAIRALALPSTRLAATPWSDETLPVGASKLGGAPDLPAGHTWPQRQDRPLAFVAQIARDGGVLSFFYDDSDQPWGGPGEEDGWRIEHHAGADLVRHPGAATFVSCKLDSFTELTLPPPRSALARSLGDAVHGTYGALYDTFTRDYRRSPRIDGQVHRSGGHPDAIQGDMTRRIEYGWAGKDLDVVDPELEAAARGWRLLLQIDSEDRANMCWGDAGRLYLWIREDDLRANRWDTVRLQLQCT